MLRAFLDEQRRQLNAFFDHAPIDDWERTLRLFHAHASAFFFTGVGKSGLVAAKIAATFASIGKPSFFLQASGALHGDIGAIRPGDLVVMLSKSGSTRELVELAPHVKHKQGKLIAIVAKAVSPLAALADEVVVLPVAKELGSFDLAPTTSTTAQMIFGDLIAMALVEMQCMSRDDFARNHPGGLIGRKMALKAADLMLRGAALPVCASNAFVIDLLHELSAKRSGCLLVVEGADRLIGIFTDGDLRRALATKGAAALNEPVAHFMTREPRTITPHTLAIDAMRQMEAVSPVTVMPVVDQGALVGLLRMHDILQMIQVPRTTQEFAHV
ncbi:MAG: hypothetical protein RL235_1136 [Chlamydiota bacterium]|jgi:arabinose-5-phosphate isomerase